MEPHLQKYMRQEALTSPALTLATVEDDVVGCIQDVAYGTWIQAASIGVRPKLGLGTGRNAYIKHDGTNDWLQVNNSLGLFRGLWSTTPTGSLMFWIKKGTDGAAMTWMNSNSSTGGQTGIKVAFTAGNKVNFWVSKDGPNVTIINYTSTASVLTTDGWVPIVCNLNGVGAGKFEMFINGTSDGTGTILAGVDKDASQLLRIGEVNDGTGDFNGQWSHFFFLNRIALTDDISWFGTYDPTVSTTLAPQVSHTIYDFSDAANMFTERSSPATNVASNDDPIGYMNNLVTYGFGKLYRDATAPSDAKRPLYKTSAQNSLSAGYWDGEISFQELNFTQWPRGGCYTFVIATRFMNDSAPTDEGRKILSDGTAGATTGTSYVTVTAESDASNTPALAGYGTTDGDPYIVAHPDGAADGIKASGRNDTINIFIVVRDGANITWYNMDGEKTTFTSTGAFYYQKLGGIAGTWANNNNFEYRVYSGIIGGSAAKQDSAAATLMASLKTKWGV